MRLVLIRRVGRRVRLVVLMCRNTWLSGCWVVRRVARRVDGFGILGGIYWVGGGSSCLVGGCLGWGKGVAFGKRLGGSLVGYVVCGGVVVGVVASRGAVESWWGVVAALVGGGCSRYAGGRMRVVWVGVGRASRVGVLVVRGLVVFCVGVVGLKSVPKMR